MTVIKEQVFNKQLDSVHCGDGCKIHRPYDNVCIWHKDLNHVSYTCDKSGPTTDESHSNWRRPSMQALCGFGPFSHCQPFWCWWATIQMFRQTLNCRVLFSLVANSLADCRRSGLSSEGPQTRWIASVKRLCVCRLNAVEFWGSTSLLNIHRSPEPGDFALCTQMHPIHRTCIDICWQLASKICGSKASADTNGTFGPAVDKGRKMCFLFHWCMRLLQIQLHNWNDWF